MISVLRRPSLAALVALFAIAWPVRAPAEGAPVAKPAVKVGDRWTYRRTDYLSSQPRGAYEIRVVFADRGVIQVVGVGKGSDEEVDTTYTDEWNAVSTRTNVFYPHTGWFRFPLLPGDSYEAEFEARNPHKGDAHSKQRRTVRVLGWEEIVVPAGRFRALKLESEGRFQRLDKPIPGRACNVIWYVPELRRWAKLTVEIRTPRGVVQHSGEELVGYRLQ